MGGKSKKAPKAPDYAAAAQAQGAADKAVAQYQTAMDRPTQVSPDGSVTWQLRPGADPNNPQAGDWIQTTSLSPQQQAIYNAQQYNQLHLQNLGSTAIGQAQNVLGQQFNPNLPSFQTPQGLQQSNVNLPQYQGQMFEGQGPQQTLDQFQNIDENVNRYSDEAARALYDKQTQFLGERFGQATDAERSRLASMGLQEGTEAYTRALDQMQRNQNAAYQTAALDATLQGYNVGSQQLGDLLAARQSNMGLQQGIFGQGQQQFQNQLNAYGANQQERTNQFQSGATQYSMDQAERQAQAQNQIQLANQAAAQRQQQFNEEAYKRSLPINEISALLSGGGVNMPQFSGFAPSAGFNAPDTLGATQAQYNAQMGAYNAQQQQKGSLLGGGLSLAGGLLGGK